jgi:hypothetical protein
MRDARNHAHTILEILVARPHSHKMREDSGLREEGWHESQRYMEEAGEPAAAC